MNDYTVVGSGLAGLLLTQALVKAGIRSITLVHYDAPLQASEAPLAICHPFPGRSLKPHPLLQSAYEATRSVMEEWRAFAPKLVTALPMIRPLKGANYDRLVRSYEQHWATHPDPWLQVQLDQELEQLVYGPCFAVALQALRPCWIKHLRDLGVTVVNGAFESMNEGGQHLLVGGRTLHTKRVILCTGRNLAQWLPPSQIIHEGGELGSFRVSHTFDHLLSQAGLHVGPLDTNTVVVGATRWETCPDEPPESALPDLQRRMEAIVGNVLQPQSAWRGVRTIYPIDRLPIAGSIPGFDHAFALGAFGSKGLLWGPLAALMLARELTQRIPVPPALNLNRVKGEATVG